MYIYLISYVIHISYIYIYIYIYLYIHIYMCVCILYMYVWREGYYDVIFADHYVLTTFTTFLIFL